MTSLYSRRDCAWPQTVEDGVAPVLIDAGLRERVDASIVRLKRG